MRKVRSGATLGAGRVREEWLRGIVFTLFGDGSMLGDARCWDERRRCDEFVKRVLQWGFLYLGGTVCVPLSYVLKDDYDSQQPKGRVMGGPWFSRHAWLDALSGACQTPRARGVM